MNHGCLQRLSAVLAVGLAAFALTPQHAIAQPPAAQIPSKPAAAEPPPSAEPALPAPTIVLVDVMEDKQHLLRATVTLGGSPLVGANVLFGATRTFGVLDLGMDTTLEDGTAAVSFPENLPGDSAGFLEAVARVEASKDHAAATVRTRLGGAGIVVQTAEPFPHALWSSKPLWPLVAVIVVLLAGVWSTYAFVVAQLVRIRREEAPR